MRKNLTRAFCALLCGGILTLATEACATGVETVVVTGLRGSGYIVEKVGGGVVSHGETDRDGQARIEGLTPGRYEIIIDGPSLVAAMDRFAPPAKSSGGGSSFSLGVGGMLGGGSHDTHDHGAGPDRASHGGSGGGLGVGVSIPLGGAPTSPSPNELAGGIETVVVTAQFLNGVSPKSGPGELIFSSATPYCREVAGGGMHFEFTVPAGSGAQGTNVFSEDPRIIGISVGASW